MEVGATLWGATYVPPIEPERRREMVDKWSGNGSGSGASDQVSGGAAGTTPTTYLFFLLVSFVSAELPSACLPLLPIQTLLSVELC